MKRNRRMNPVLRARLNQEKFQICHLIDYEISFMQMTTLGAAQMLGTTAANISRIRNKKVDQLRFNQLFQYLAMLRPEFRMLVSPY